jgi:CheY-like chemotaxis protein
MRIQNSYDNILRRKLSMTSTERRAEKLNRARSSIGSRSDRMEYHTALMTVNERMILLVEDDPDHEALTIRALKKANIANNIRVAHDGEEALQMLFGQGENSLPYVPQVILLDLKLPKIDGLEVLRRIRESEQHRMLPVVILTSSDEESDLMRSYKLGVNSYIRKPVNFTDFAEATRQLGMYWLVLNEGPPVSLR